MHESRGLFFLGIRLHVYIHIMSLLGCGGAVAAIVFWDLFVQQPHDREMERLRSKMDKDEDNILDGDSVPATAAIHLSSGPRRRWL